VVLAVRPIPNERAAVRAPRALDDIAVSELPLSGFAEPAPLFIRLRNRDDAFLAVDRHRRIQGTSNNDDFSSDRSLAWRDGDFGS
jgi:hypothetical protein